MERKAFGTRTINAAIVIAVLIGLGAAVYRPLVLDRTMSGDGSELAPLGVDTTDLVTTHAIRRYAFLPGTSGGQILIGGTGTTDDLVLQSTAGVGASGAEIQFKVGNNGATTAMRIDNSGFVGIGMAPSSSLPLAVYKSSGTETGIIFDHPTLNSTADIRLGSDQPRAIRLYADDAVLTSSPAGAGFQAFNNNSASFPGQIYFDSGAHNNAKLSFRTAATSGTITERMQITSGGDVGIGNITPSALLHVQKTTEQLRVGYNSSNYYSTTVGSTGGVTLNAVGSGSRFTFSDVINIPTATPSSASATGTTGDIAWDGDYIYICVATNTWKRVAISTW